MYIINSEIIKNKYECKYNTYIYLKNNGFPLLSRNNDRYYFALTDKLKECLKHIPFLVKCRDLLKF